MLGIVWVKSSLVLPRNLAIANRLRVSSAHTHSKNIIFFWGGSFPRRGSIWDTGGGCCCWKHKFQCEIVVHGEETFMMPLVPISRRCGHSKHKLTGHSFSRRRSFSQRGNLCDTLYRGRYAAILTNKSRNLCTPLAFDALVGGPRLNFTKCCCDTKDIYRNARFG